MGVTVERDVMVPMRDGVRFATDVYLPEGHAPGTPVLLYRTPYNKDEMARNFGFSEFFASHGYVVVQQDCRGCFKSEGDTDFLRPEAADGYDTLQWIAAQPWGDADVGSWGTSWSGWTQTAMAAMGPSRLKTMVPMMSGTDAYSSSVRHGGALELRWIAWAFWHAAENTQAGLKTDEAERALVHAEKRFSDWLKQWPIRRGETQLRHVPAYERWAFDLLEHEDRGDYWEHPSYRPEARWPNYPQASALHIGSWYDSYTRATFEHFVGHREHGIGKTKLLIGPWMHGTTTVEQSFSGEVEFGRDAAIANYQHLLLAWFDHELRGQGADERAPVRLFIMGGGSGGRDANGRLLHGGVWRDEKEWPLARTDFQRFHLTAAGGLAHEIPAAGARTYRYDPNDPVPSIGGNVSSHQNVIANPPANYHALPSDQRKQPVVAAGGFDQTGSKAKFAIKPSDGPLAERSDVLVFQTPPLTEATEITGPLKVHLWVSSSAADTDFTAKLIDVYPPSSDWPDGYALNIGDSIIRLCYRDGTGIAKPVAPNTIVPVTIELYPTGNVFVEGHRIRLDISSSNYPRFDRNPNTGKPYVEANDTVVAENTLYFGPEHPSHIVLPIIPA
jgi:putative CocE/NonD family hydrolase